MMFKLEFIHGKLGKNVSEIQHKSEKLTMQSIIQLVQDLRRSCISYSLGPPLSWGPQKNCPSEQLSYAKGDFNAICLLLNEINF